ncbi:ABC transporter substrate-binding protein [Oceaniglobus trochenteri]|uniref:ABC transporter substrate-binding protein n=1 Tax=Oceaniglobus trochenteri TaxID=2763260 RepID=UPI001CFFB57A|nr:extracellular solute-binding protein [Oceaniglobus trochenteri]
MMPIGKLSAAMAVFLSTTVAAHADCGIEKGSVRLLSNNFEALRAIGRAVQDCASDSVEVTINQTIEHKTIQGPALSSDPAAYTVAMIASNSIVPLLNANLVRPLDDYVAKWGQDLQDHQLIRVDGKIMAIAFMANGQHLFYRRDILEDNGITPPETFADVVKAAQALRDAGVMEAPFAASYKPGWDIAAEFVNLYLGTGADFFKPGSAELDIQNQNGIATLETMKALSGQMRKDFITDDANTLAPLWKEGQLAMLIAWGSRARELLDTTESEFAGETVLSAMPAVEAGGVPAAALWWDGFALARNISDEDAEASFRAMMHAASPEMARDHRESAVWLIKGYEPTPPAKGVAANIAGGARPYPMTPYMGLLHGALSENLAEFIQGEETAEQALEDVSRAYGTAARESGFLD